MEFYSKGNEAFVAEDYDQAIKFYTDAIAADNDRSDFYLNRSQTYVKLQKYSEALSDAVKAVDLDSNNTKAHLRRGIAHFHLEDYQSAKDAFTEGQNKDASDNNFKTWIQKCEAELNVAQQLSGSSGTSGVTTGTSTSAPPVPMPTGPKTRYDWYQTETHVAVTVMLKKVKQEDFTVDIQPRNMSLTVKLPGGSDYSLELALLHDIVPERSSSKIMSTKIEIKLAKKEGIRWTSLEGEEPAELKHFQPKPATHSYPSSSHHTKDWDKLAKEITKEEKDKLEGEAALNNLFQQIYSDGSDEIRKAMNKSFTESGGTVLSTNWQEIAAKKTEIKPPDGMEYKKWDQ